MSMGSPPPPPGHESPGGPPPWGPPPGGPYGGPYGPGAYGAYYAPGHPQGTTVMVIGILGLVVCQLLGPVAWIMGNNAIAEIDANPMAYSNRSAVQAGRICGIVSTAILVFSAVIFLIVLLVAASSSS